MCGIVGYLGSESAAKIEARLKFMMSCIRHRGPDADGILVEGGFGLGHVRLSIIDLNMESNQPFLSSNKRYSIVFNGEIYNYKEIRNHLIYEGVQFRTTSDTEVLLEAYIHYGTRCLQFLDGMFSFAIFDKVSDHFFCARDRIGEKPFYYSWTDRYGFLFSSEFEALIHARVDIDQICFDSLKNFLSHAYMKGPKTLLSNCEQLTPGHYMIIERGKNPIQKCYWSPVEVAKSSILVKDSRSLVEDFRYQFDASVKKCTVSDVPFGAFLSGGIDSSCVVESIVRQGLNSKSFKTFTLEYPELGFSESSLAIKTSKVLGIQAELVPYDDFIREIPSIIYQAARIPIADPSFIPLSIVSKVAGSKFKVMLGGDGGDELLLGYDTYRATILSNLLGNIDLKPAKGLISFIIRLLQNSSNKNVSIDEKLFRFIEYRVTGEPILSHAFWRTIFSSDELYNILKKDRIIASAYTNNNTPVDARWQTDINIPLLVRASILDYKSWLGDGVLRKLDGALMYNSIEGRSPFLDHNLIEFGFKLPVNQKMNINFGKLPLRSILREAGLSHVLSRGKTGFGFPLDELFRGSLREFLFDEIKGKVLKEIFNIEYVDKILLEHDSKKFNHGRRLYCLLIISIWLNTSFGKNNV